MFGFDIIFSIMGLIVPILAAGIFVYVFAMMLSPKFRGKIMAREAKAKKYMLEESGDMLQDIATEEARIVSPGIETKAQAFKRGWSGESIYCKHCGAVIDGDSTFCKVCGNKQ